MNCVTQIEGPIQIYQLRSGLKLGSVDYSRKRAAVKGYGRFYSSKSIKRGEELDMSWLDHSVIDFTYIY